MGAQRDFVIRMTNLYQLGVAYFKGVLQSIGRMKLARGKIGGLKSVGW